MIELKEVSTKYEDNFIALKRVSLVVKDGEFISVVGPAGAGKSSLLHAGILGSFGRSEWAITLMRPGEDPLDSFVRASGPAGLRRLGRTNS